MIDNEHRFRWLGRAIGFGLLAAFAIAIYQGVALGDDAIAAAANDGPLKLGLSLTAKSILDAAMVVTGVFVAAAFFFLLRPVSTPLSLLASALRLVAAALTGYGIYIAHGVIGEIEAMPSGASVEALTGPLEALNALNFDLFHWGLIASSLGAMLNYALLFAGRFIPRVIAGYGVLASLGAATGAGAIYLAPSLSEVMYPAYAMANALAFLSLTFWLLVFGADARYWKEKTARTI